jgi:4-amino-4-deoxy-L-arabinose transferase-like glycosyltransferase
MSTVEATPEVAHARWRDRPNFGFWLWTTALAALGLGIRIAAVLGRPNRSLGGDPEYFHDAANLLVEGYGFIDPFHFYMDHVKLQTAAWPPLFVWVLAMAAVVGFKSYFAQRIWCGIIGAIAVVVCAMAGREIGGRRVGILTALVIAIYPNIWMSDEPALSETLTPLLVGIVLWSAYRFWKQPSLKRAAVMSLCLAVTVLGRDELTTLFLFLAVPLCLLARDTAWRRRLLMVGAVAAVAVLVVGPWVGYNFSRFSRPVFISDGLGVTLASADCAQTFGSGQLEGFWDIHCALAAKIPKGVDESVRADIEQDHAVKFLKSHLNRLVPVALAKVGRGFAFFRPLQQINLDAFFEERPKNWALVGLWSYYGLLALSVGGAVVLARRKITCLPLAAVTLAVVVTMMIAFGDTRYRTPFEIVLAILASVAVDGLCNVLRRTRPEVTGPPRARREDAPELPGTPIATGGAGPAVAGEPASSAVSLRPARWLGHAVTEPRWRRRRPSGTPAPRAG